MGKHYFNLLHCKAAQLRSAPQPIPPRLILHIITRAKAESALAHPPSSHALRPAVPSVPTFAAAAQVLRPLVPVEVDHDHLLVLSIARTSRAGGNIRDGMRVS